jgi:ppGpp synthetase/RelA/SpoT-type nucleotidyltranferase
MRTAKSFLRQYGFEDNALAVAGISWSELVAIYQDHSKRTAALGGVASMLVSRYEGIPEAYFIKHRVKDPEHLLEKVLRLAFEDKKVTTSFLRYKKDIGDLIGIRILHRFKDQWESIHDQITRVSSIRGKPEVYCQRGDPESLLKAYRRKGIVIKEKKVGYRSIHYDLVVSVDGEEHYAELQVRTLFEEAWGEIDHDIRYPYDIGDPLLNQYFETCALVSGLADELGSLTRLHKREKELAELAGKKANLERLQIVKKIEDGIERLGPRAEQVQKKLEGFGK